MKKKNKNNHFELKNSNIKPLSSFTIFLIIFSSSISILAIVSIIINNTNITLLQTSSPLFYIIIVLIISEIAAMLVYIFYTKKITKGFEIIMEAADHIADGDFNYKIEKSIPKEFEPLKTRMNNVLENLKKLEISKNDYTAYFSHEFKTPLASIIGFAKILKNNDLSLTERNEYISIIIEESERLSKLANNNLLLNKIDNKTLILKKENILLNILNNNCDKIGKKNYAVVDREKLLNKWIKRVRNSHSFVPLSSAIKVKVSGSDIRDKICEGFLGSLMSCGSDLQKQNLTAIFSAPQASAGSLSITKDNFQKAMIIHAIRRITKVNWLNGSDQFIIPKCDIEGLSEEFKIDCVIWSLFASSNQTVSMNNVFYKDKYYKIENHFYPFDYKEVFSNNNFFDYNNEKRFAFEYLKNKEKIMTKESFDLLNIGKELYKFFYENIEKINLNKYKISLWDCGFWQIRKSLKEIKIGLDILDKIKLKREILRENIFKEVWRFIS